jgi:phospholipid/cholesterol/gamma-HCH transport system substrate-binding protein
VSARRILLVASSALVVMVTLAGCGGSGAPGPRTVTAVFSDVGNLTDGAQVQLAEVPIGRVTSIALEGDKAKVTMELSRSARVPANVTAALSQTTILGDQFIEMEVPKSGTGTGTATKAGTTSATGSSGAAAGAAAQLRNGAVIRHTTIVPDVEQLVQAGAQVFGSVSTTELEQIIAAGGEGFTGQEASLKAFLSDLSSVATSYAQHTSQFSTAINGMNELSATLAPSSGATATALTTLSKTVAILAQQSSQFETLLQSLDNLSIQGRQIVETYYPQIVTQLQALTAVSGQLSQNQADLAGVLRELPANDSALPSSVRAGYLQLYENIIVCGLPDGGENDSSPAFTCAPTGSSGK